MFDKFKAAFTTKSPALPAEEVKRLDVSFECAHGRLGKKTWPNAKLTRYIDADNRPGYQSVNASEYEDDDVVLVDKVKQLVTMLKESKNCLVYTGAGISTSAGIPDYATRKEGEETKDGAASGPVELLYRRPTLSHRVLVALYEAGILKHWVQQNHDGLPQKAGYPQKAINEIHGGWFDPSNMVVPMDGHLREDLCKLRDEWTEKTDLVLVLGTSLAGMSTDSMCSEPANRAAKGVGLGSVIISIQQTPHDHESSLRIFCKLDKVFELVAKELNLTVAPMSTPLMKEERDIFMVPYYKTGKLIDRTNPKEIEKPTPLLKLDLTVGTKVMQNNGYFRGALGQVIGRNPDGHWLIEFDEVDKIDGCISVNTVVRALGAWWGKTLENGEVPVMPIRNR